jgi:hypothetical protein
MTARLGALLVLCACSGGGSNGGTGGGTGGGGGSGGSGGGQQVERPVCTGTCNSVTLGGPLVLEQRSGASAPALSGGPPATGTYHLTSVVGYLGDGGAAGPSGVRYMSTFTFDGGTMESVEAAFEADGGFVAGDGGCARRTFAMSFDGGRATILRSCPGMGAPFTFPYGTTANTFTQDFGGFHLTYTRQ